jgi:hypothetical protein
MANMKRLIATLLWTTFLLGCGGSSSVGGGPTLNAQLNGSWHATLTSTASGGSFPLDIFIVQNGTTLSSDKISVQGMCSSINTMSGSVSGSKLNFIITGNTGDTVSITGTASGGNSFSGSYTIKTSGCINGDTGTLSATLIPSVQSSSWTGTTQSTTYPPGITTFTASLNEDSSGNVTGVLTFTGSSCSFLATESETGAQMGNIMYLSDNSPNGINLGGTMDAAAKSISGTYSISICHGDNGTFTMSRP